MSSERNNHIKTTEKLDCLELQIILLLKKHQMDFLCNLNTSSSSTKLFPNSSNIVVNEYVVIKEKT